MLFFVLGVTLSLVIAVLRKHAYSNILKILPQKNENFQIKYSDIFHISAQNINCGYSLEPPRRGGSNEYQQSMLRGSNEYQESMFFSRNKKTSVYSDKPQFYYIKVEFKGVKFIYACYRDGTFFMLRPVRCLTGVFNGAYLACTFH